MKAVGKEHNNTFTVKVKMSDKTSVLGKAVAKATGIKSGFRLLVAGKEVYPFESWRAIDEYEQGLKGTNNTIIMTVGLAGGAPKRSRATSATGKDRDQIPVAYTPPQVVQTDINQVVAALQVKVVDIPAWLDTMSVQRLRDFYESYDETVKASGYVDRHVNMMMEYVKEHNDLAVPLV